MSTSLHGWQLSCIFGLLCPTWWLGGWKLCSKGPPRPPKRDPKIIKKSSKIHPGTPWHSQGCQGVPPRCLQCIFMRILCIFVHIFMHIYAYLCTFMYMLCIFMLIYAYLCIYLCIFMHTYVCLMHMYASLYIFMHTYSYLRMFIHKKT